MTVKVSTKIDLEGSQPKSRLVYRTEAVDDSGQPSMAGPWRELPVDQVAHYVHRGVRVVIEEYDKDRHGVVV